MRAIGAGEVGTHLPNLLHAVEHRKTTASTDPSAVIADIRSARAGRAVVSCTDLLSARDDGRKPCRTADARANHPSRSARINWLWPNSANVAISLCPALSHQIIGLVSARLGSQIGAAHGARPQGVGVADRL